MTCLLDVNALVALAWPNHVHHASAQRWFAGHQSEGWATCPLTESGFVRVSSSLRATPEDKTPGEALLLLRKMIDLPSHDFWEDDVSPARDENVVVDRLLGHRQVTEAHLLCLAIRLGGRLLTFDRGVLNLVPDSHDPEKLVVLLDLVQ